MILFQALSGVGEDIQVQAQITQNTALSAALNTQFLFQIGIFTAVPMVLGFILEQGFFRVNAYPTCFLILLIIYTGICNSFHILSICILYLWKIIQSFLHHATELYVQCLLSLMLKIIVYQLLLVPFFLAVCPWQCPIKS